MIGDIHKRDQFLSIETDCLLLIINDKECPILQYRVLCKELAEISVEFLSSFDSWTAHN